MAANVLNRKGDPLFTYKFEPIIESAVVENTLIIIDKQKGQSKNKWKFEIRQARNGKIAIPKDRMEDFAKELIDIAKMCEENWNAEMFR